MSYTRGYDGITLTAYLLVSVLCAVICSAGIASAQNDMSHPGYFKLDRGQRYSLCREFDANLKLFPQLNQQTMEWPIDPKFKDFRKPVWQKINALQNMDVIQQIYIYYNNPKAHPDAEVWPVAEPQVREWIVSGDATLETTSVDFDGSGHKSIAYRFYHPMKQVWLSPTGENHMWDVHAYWYIFYSRDDGPISGYRVPISTLFVYADSFLFKGRFFLISWSGPGPTIWELRSVRNFQDHLAPYGICDFSYVEE
jgi:hypothetical protein